MHNKVALLKACELALAGHWEGAHNIAQDYSDDTANWIHAVLHKIEGDSSNSRYWYAKTKGKKYEDFSEANTELIVIQNSLNPP
ncbi:MAG: hypothetical protein H7Z20_09680 [Bdellovibrio sp.]|nr:hypothetical protein [Methylotenera sp.]